jgi:diguanylate cyclase (GGDEF)-like protein
MEAQEVLNLARSIKDGVENLKFGCLDGEACFNATISLGISYKRVTLQNSFIELYEEADVSLYKAKRNGRNTIVFGTEIYK